MKNTTVLVVGVGLVGGLTGLALVAGRGAPAPRLDVPPAAATALAPRIPPNVPPTPSPGTAVEAPPPGMDAPRPPPGAAVDVGTQSTGAVMSREPPSTAMRPGMTRIKGGMRVTAASVMMVPGAPELPREDATVGMQTVLSGIAPCLEKLAQKANQDVNAQVSLEFWGGKEGGHVRNGAVTSLSPEDATARGCVTDFLVGVKFRAPREGAMRMDIPLAFSMRDDLFGAMPGAPGTMGSPPPGAMMGSPPPGGMMGNPPPGGMMGSPPPGGMMGSPPPGGMMGSPPPGAVILNGPPPQGP